MKRMLPLLLLLGLPAQAQADGTEANYLRFENRDYQLHRVGEKLWVSPLRVERKAGIVKGAAPDCEEFEKRIAAMKDGIDACADATSAYCKMTLLRIYLLAEGRTRAEDAPDIFQRKVNMWALEDEAPAGVNEAGLLAAAARAGAVSEASVKLNLRPRTWLKAVPSLRFDQNSLVSRVQGAAKFTDAALAAWSNTGFTTSNAFAACDILAGRAHFKGEAGSELSSSDATPELVTNTAWKAYEALANNLSPDYSQPRTTQAFKIGYYLGKKVPELAQPLDPRLTLNEIFARFFDQASFGFMLKEYGSKESLRLQAFPSQSFYVTIRHDWSL